MHNSTNTVEHGAIGLTLHVIPSRIWDGLLDSLLNIYMYHGHTHTLTHTHTQVHHSRHVITVNVYTLIIALESPTFAPTLHYAYLGEFPLRFFPSLQYKIMGKCPVDELGI